MLSSSPLHPLVESCLRYVAEEDVQLYNLEGGSKPEDEQVKMRFQWNPQWDGSVNESHAQFYNFFSELGPIFTHLTQVAGLDMM